jgi:ABC-type glycerol-3-phosphate transport system substrate-binding protein
LKRPLGGNSRASPWRLGLTDAAKRKEINMSLRKRIAAGLVAVLMLVACGTVDDPTNTTDDGSATTSTVDDSTSTTDDSTSTTEDASTSTTEDDDTTSTTEDDDETTTTASN